MLKLDAQRNFSKDITQINLFDQMISWMKIDRNKEWLLIILQDLNAMVFYANNFQRITKMQKKGIMLHFIYFYDF